MYRGTPPGTHEPPNFYPRETGPRTEEDRREAAHGQEVGRAGLGLYASAHNEQYCGTPDLTCGGKACLPFLGELNAVTKNSRAR